MNDTRLVFELIALGLIVVVAWGQFLNWCDMKIRQRRIWRHDQRRIRLD